MDYGEFVSDRYVSLQYQHHFEGLFLNRIPLIRKLKWRFVGTANMIYGSLNHSNRELMPVQNTPPGEEPEYLEVGSFSKDKPYVELGYGVENIFRFIRVDFVHRLTYLDKTVNADVRKWGVFVSFQFAL
jgi:hypothetical protein